MSDTVIPLKFRAGVSRFDETCEGWSLLAPEPNETRVVVGSVEFDEGFAVPPVVHAGIAGFDIDNGANARLDVRVATISPLGFSLELRTWLNTRIWSVSVSWLAIGH
jgi:hypothetical protein